MSGGSFDYLFLAIDVDGVLGLANRTDDIKRMADRLQELGHHSAALYTRTILGSLALAQINIGREAGALKDVWKAVEWLDSCDWGEDKVTEAVQEWAKEFQA